MDNAAALKLAVELVHMPSRVRAARAEPVPPGIDMLLQIAAGEETLMAQAAALTDRTPQVILQAAGFFIEQILLSPESDSYRVLGATSTASSTELRRNMALLLRWLHPDMDSQGERSLYAGRVTKAWEDLKTPERRAAYDATLLAAVADKAASASKFADRNRSRKRRNGSPSHSGVGGVGELGGMAAPSFSAGARPRQPHEPSGLMVRALRFLFGSPRR